MRFFLALVALVVLARWWYTSWWQPHEQVVLAWMAYIAKCVALGLVLLAVVVIMGAVAWHYIRIAIATARSERAARQAQESVDELYDEAYQQVAEIVQQHEGDAE